MNIKVNIFFYSKKNIKSKYKTLTNVSTAINYCSKLQYIAVDTETTGFDPYLNKLTCLQIGDNYQQHVIDIESFPVSLFKNLLESKPLIFQNALFDLRFLYKENIFPNKVYDTFLAETKLTQGLHVKRNLQALEEKYCDSFIVDKSNRGELNQRGFNDISIKYCAADIAVLHIIKEKQLEIAAKNNMKLAIKLENSFVLALAYTQFCGLYIDQDKWLVKANKAEKELKEAETALNKYLLNSKYLKFVDTQLNLFTNTVDLSINWNSEKQVGELFKQIGINIDIEKKIKGKTVIKQSIQKNNIEKQCKQFEILPLYLKYKQLEKDVSTYGKSFLEGVNPITHRIHSNFTQIVNTGRMASGGKLGNMKTINLQNLPNNEETRKCFTAQWPTHNLVNADYTGQEQIIVANKSLDKDLLKFYDSKLGDMHSFIASKIYPELKDLPLKEIKANHADLRSNSKRGGFAILYGGTGYTVSKNLNLSIEEGINFEKAYFKAFPGLKNYFDKCEQDAIKYGFILIDEITGGRLYLNIDLDIKTLQNKYSFSNKEFWNYYKQEKKKNSKEYKKEKENISNFFSIKNYIRRKALNTPIQGTGALITKLAGILLMKWIKKNNYINIVKIVNIIHDEIMTEQPKEIADKTAIAVQNCMETAASIFCKRVKLYAEPMVVDYWLH